MNLTWVVLPGIIKKIMGELRIETGLFIVTRINNADRRTQRAAIGR